MGIGESTGRSVFGDTPTSPSLSTSSPVSTHPGPGGESEVGYLRRKYRTKSPSKTESVQDEVMTLLPRPTLNVSPSFHSRQSHPPDVWGKSMWSRVPTSQDPTCDNELVLVLGILVQVNHPTLRIRPLCVSPVTPVLSPPVPDSQGTTDPSDTSGPTCRKYSKEPLNHETVDGRGSSLVGTGPTRVPLSTKTSGVTRADQGSDRHRQTLQLDGLTVGRVEVIRTTVPTLTCPTAS